MEQNELVSEKKKTGLIIGLCIGIVALLAVAAVLLYFLVFSPASVTLSADFVTIDSTDAIRLTTAIQPDSALNKDIVWTTDDSSVATVSDGIVTGVDAGTCTVTATTANGKSASCTVTVEVRPADIALSESEILFDIGETATLSAEVYPENATDKTVIWATDDSSVATVLEGTVTAVSAGTCTVTATIANGITASCRVTVEVPVYDAVLPGCWYCTRVMDIGTYKPYTPREFGIESYLIFYDDHTLVMSSDDEIFDFIEWEYLATDDVGDYRYVMYDGADEYTFYYVVRDELIWLYIGDYVFTYEK